MPGNDPRRDDVAAGRIAGGGGTRPVASACQGRERKRVEVVHARASYSGRKLKRKVWPGERLNSRVRRERETPVSLSRIAGRI